MALSGAEHVQRLVRNSLNAQFFPIEQRNMITGKKELVKVSGVWRPIEFGHYVFPEPCLNQVMSMLELPAKMKTFESVPYMNTYSAVMRKILKLKKIPDMSELPPLTPEELTARTIAWHEHLNIIPIGIREDAKGIRQFSDGSVLDKEHL